MQVLAVLISSGGPMGVGIGRHTHYCQLESLPYLLCPELLVGLEDGAVELQKGLDGQQGKGV